MKAHTHRHGKTTTMTEQDTETVLLAGRPDRNERVGGQAEEASWLETSPNEWNL